MLIPQNMKRVLKDLNLFRVMLRRTLISTPGRILKRSANWQNVKAGVCYPATLLTTADHDDRVVPSHSYKFAATLQKEQMSVSGCEKPVLLRVEAQGSHGYRPLDRRIAELADIWSFAAYHLGMTVRQPNTVVQ